jgi:hypothetical protein
MRDLRGEQYICRLSSWFKKMINQLDESIKNRFANTYTEEKKTKMHIITKRVLLDCCCF